MNTQAIADYLNIEVSSIKKITELHYVFCVVIEGKRPVFVSKRKLDNMVTAYYTIEGGKSNVPLRRIGYTTKQNAIEEFNEYFNKRYESLTVEFAANKYEALLVQRIQMPTYLEVKVILEKC